MRFGSRFMSIVAGFLSLVIAPFVVGITLWGVQTAWQFNGTVVLLTSQVSTLTAQMSALTARVDSALQRDDARGTDIAILRAKNEQQDQMLQAVDKRLERIEADALPHRR